MIDILAFLVWEIFLGSETTFGDKFPELVVCAWGRLVVDGFGGGDNGVTL